MNESGTTARAPCGARARSATDHAIEPRRTRRAQAYSQRSPRAADRRSNRVARASDTAAQARAARARRTPERSAPMRFFFRGPRGPTPASSVGASWSTSGISLSAWVGRPATTCHDHARAAKRRSCMGYDEHARPLLEPRGPQRFQFYDPRALPSLTLDTLIECDGNRIAVRLPGPDRYRRTPDVTSPRSRSEP